MHGYVTNLEEETKNNSFFRKVLYTDENIQLVVMNILPGEDIGAEVHRLDQFIRIEQGTGEAFLNGEAHMITDGSAIVVPKGTMHTIVNTSATEPLKLYTVYAPPNHTDGTVHETKAAALLDEAEHFDGVTTEPKELLG